MRSWEDYKKETKKLNRQLRKQRRKRGKVIEPVGE